MHGPHHLRLTAFARAVVHDGHARTKRVNDHRRVRARLSVVQSEQHIHSAEPIIRTHQLELLVLREVAEMNRSKSPKREMNPDRLGILGVVLASFEAGAGRIRPAAARQRGLDYFARGGHDAYIDAAESNLVARFGDCMPGAGVKSRVRLLEK